MATSSPALDEPIAASRRNPRTTLPRWPRGINWGRRTVPNDRCRAAFPRACRSPQVPRYSVPSAFLLPCLSQPWWGPHLIRLYHTAVRRGRRPLCGGRGQFRFRGGVVLSSTTAKLSKKSHDGRKSVSSTPLLEPAIDDTPFRIPQQCPTNACRRRGEQRRGSSVSGCRFRPPSHQAQSASEGPRWRFALSIAPRNGRAKDVPETVVNWVKSRTKSRTRRCERQGDS